MNQLFFPNKLYGRSREITSLLEAFERTSKRKAEILLVPGYSGVGKTVLIQELREPVEKKNGLFIQGKFNQYQQNVPYFAFRQALLELLHKVKSETNPLFYEWKNNILRAVGNQGKLLVDLVPEFESFLGPQPPLPDIPPLEAQHRFTELIKNFFMVFCRPEHPVVLFIDDWQWTDTASCELLKKLQLGTNLQYLLVIVSYRSNEVDSDHPLITMAEELRRQAIPVSTLEVRNLKTKDIQDLLSDTFKPSVEDFSGLTAFINERTHGNSFFLRTYLEFLHEFDFLCFDPTSENWRWNIDKIKEEELPDDIVNLFLRKLDKFDPSAKNLLSLAACLGNRFTLEMLSIVCEQTPADCWNLLRTPIDMNIILPLNDSNSRPNDSHIPHQAMFMHDRVQQAAHSLINPEDLPKVQLAIGRILLKHLSPEQLEEKLFEVVNHLNAGRLLIQDLEEQVKTIELNVRAAHKAFSATAYRTALQFHREAGCFLQNSELAEYLWNEHHELMMRLLLAWAESEFLEGDHEKAKRCIDQAVDRAANAIEKAKALNILIIQYTLLARYPEAIKVACLALEDLDITLPEDDYETARNAEIALVRQELKVRSITSLADLPVMSDPEKSMAAKILITMGPPCYRSHQRLWSVIVPKVVNLTIQYGNIPQVGYSHTAFGGLLGWVDNDFSTAKDFSDLAIRLMNNIFKSPSDQSVFYLMVGSSTRHWFKHLRHSSNDYTEAYEIGLKSGNLQYAAYAFGHNMYCCFYQGAELKELIRQSHQSLEFSRSRLNQWAIDLIEGGLNIFNTLANENEAGTNNDAFSEEDYLSRVDDHHNIQVTCIYKILKTFSLLVLGYHEQALALSDETEPIIYTVGTQGLLPWPEHVFARMMIFTALYKDTDGNCQDVWRSELEKMLQQIHIWADYCPENYGYKLYLALAELARIDKRPIDAMIHYDEAIEAAQAGGFCQWEAFANERASFFWKTNGSERLAQVYWQQAFACYDRWGALAKLRSMGTAYPELLLHDFIEGVEPDFQGKALLEKARNTLLDKQFRLLRRQSKQTIYMVNKTDSDRKSEELFSATQNLRTEIAVRKQIQDELQKSEERLREIIDSSPFPVAVVDLQDENILFWSRSAITLFGHTVQTTAEWFQLAYPDPNYRNEVISRWEPFLEIARESGEPVNTGEYNITCKDGSVRICELFATFFPDRLIVTLNDITEKKSAEANLVQSQKMETVGTLAGGVAHEFNNILSGILGYTELAKEDASEDSSVLESLDEIFNLSIRARDIVKQILSFSRKENIEQKPLQPHLTIEESVKVLRATIPTSVEIRLNIDKNSGTIMGDPTQIQQVGMNLCMNAAHAMEDKGGILEIGLAPVAIDAEDAKKYPDLKTGEYLKLTVSDTGSGIDPRNINRIFDPFFTTKEVGKGSGMGLSVVHGIIKDHGGSICVNSKVGQGTTFDVFLPRTEKTIEEKNNADAIPKGTENILVVDDEEHLVFLMKTILGRMGYNVTAMTNSLETLELFKKNPQRYDLIITDLTMPHLTGDRLASEITAIRPDMPVIIATGYADAVDNDKVKQSGIKAFIPKPYQKHELAKTLRLVLDGKN